MSRLLRRALAGVLATAFVVVSAAPCLAGETATRRNASLTSNTSLTSKLSAASLEVLKAPATNTRATQDPSTPSNPGSFFRSPKGAVALALVAGAIGFAIWSQHDSRKEVKSPVR